MQPKLIVHFDKTILHRLSSLTVIWGASLVWILWVNQWGFLGRFIQWFCIFFDLLILVAASYTYFLIKSPQPAAIIDQSGIWVKHFGHIPWTNIVDVSNYQWSRSSPFVQLGITVKDIEPLRKQAALAGKVGIFWSNRCKYPPVIISNIELSNQTVIDFAQQFLHNKSGHDPN